MIYEAVAGVGGIFIVADILMRTDAGFRLIELSAVAPGFPEPLRSVAVRVHVLRQAGIDVVSAWVLHPACEHGRKPSDHAWLTVGVTEDVALLVPQVPSYLAYQLAGLLDAADAAADGAEDELADGSVSLERPRPRVGDR